jgi:hypothetical protein
MTKFRPTSEVDVPAQTYSVASKGTPRRFPHHFHPDIPTVANKGVLTGCEQNVRVQPTPVAIISLVAETLVR